MFHISVVYVNRACSGKSFLGHSQLAPVLEPRVSRNRVSKDADQHDSESKKTDGKIQMLVLPTLEREIERFSNPAQDPD